LEFYGARLLRISPCIKDRLIIWPFTENAIYYLLAS
jgi:hypothetical protein